MWVGQAGGGVGGCWGGGGGVGQWLGQRHEAVPDAVVVGPVDGLEAAGLGLGDGDGHHALGGGVEVERAAGGVGDGGQAGVLAGLAEAVLVGDPGDPGGGGEVGGGGGVQGDGGVGGGAAGVVLGAVGHRGVVGDDVGDADHLGVQECPRRRRRRGCRSGRLPATRAGDLVVQHADAGGDDLDVAGEPEAADGGGLPAGGVGERPDVPVDPAGSSAGR